MSESKLWFSVLLGTALLAAGCRAGRDSREVELADFARPPQTQPAQPPGAPEAAVETPPAALEAADASEDADAAAIERELDRLPRPQITAGAPAPATATGPAAYPMDAMVGQVNGRPIYRSSVLEPLEDVLRQYGQNYPRAQFIEEVGKLIKGRLDEIVINALILGEAERDLSEREQQGLRHMMRQDRDELLRRWGSGSEYVANQALLAKTGKTLEQVLEERRQALVIRRYMSQRLYPKINVTRRDIERYYTQNARDFNPPPARTVRVIRARQGEAADQLEAMLGEGRRFAEVAASRLNRFQPDQGGLMSEKVTSSEPFNERALNEAMLTLAAGQHSPRIDAEGDAWWVFVEAVERPPAKSLREAQLEIEDRLRRERFQALSQRYRERLTAQGSYNPVDQMTAALLEVAVNRYAMAE